MIKSAIIFVLVILLAGGAFLSRPTKQGFEAYVRDQAKMGSDNLISRVLASWQIDTYVESITFKDRFLWVEVEQNGKTQFIGAFSKFFAVGDTSTGGEKPAAQPTNTAKATADDGRDKLID